MNPLTLEISQATPKKHTLFDIQQLFSRLRDEDESADSDTEKKRLFISALNRHATH